MALSIRVTGDEDLRDFSRRTRLFGRHLRGALHDEFRQAGEAVAEQARRNVLAAKFPGVPGARRPSPPRSTGLRVGLAASVQVLVRQAGNGVEARVVSRHPMTRPTDGRYGGTWRHPVHGHDRWAAQATSPWFSAARRQAGPAAQEAAAATARDALGRLGRWRSILR